MESNWPKLLPEILSIIFGKVTLVDYIRCSFVCTSWHNFIKKDKGCSLKPQIPWLLLRGADKNSHYQFWDMANDSMYHIDLPELRYSKVIGSCEGWLIYAHLQFANVYAVNPITRAHMSFPSASSIPEYRTSFAGALAACPRRATLSIETRNDVVTYTVAVLCMNRIIFSKAGDLSWTELQVPLDLKDVISDIVFHKELLYVTDTKGYAFCFNLSNGLVPEMTIEVAPSVTLPESWKVSINRHLLWLPDKDVILQIWASNFMKKPNVYRVFRLDSVSGQWMEIRDLDRHSLFTVDCGDGPPSMTIIFKCDGTLKTTVNGIYAVCEDQAKIFYLKEKSDDSGDISYIATLPVPSNGPVAWITPSFI